VAVREVDFLSLDLLHVFTPPEPVATSRGQVRNFCISSMLGLLNRPNWAKRGRQLKEIQILVAHLSSRLEINLVGSPLPLTFCYQEKYVDWALRQTVTLIERSHFPENDIISN
jgi:hypothetical protein